MKILKIETGCGYYKSGKQVEWQQIDKIDKVGLLALLDLVLEQEVELEPFDEAKLQNQAHVIIYENVYNKLNEVAEDKVQFKDESERLYLEEIQKYSNTQPQTSEQP